MDFFVLLVLIGIIIFFSHTIQSLTGFGAGILALPFLLLLIPVNEAVFLLAVIGVALSGVMTIRMRKFINRKAVLEICIYMLIGMPFGIIATAYFDEIIVKLVLALVMIVVGTFGLIGISPKKLQHKFFDVATLSAGGIVHGAFGCGGALLIIYAGKTFKDKSEFRASLSLVWVMLSPIVLIKTIIIGNFGIDTLWYSLAMLPLVALSIFIGNRLAPKINNQLFRKIIYAVLIVCGFVMGITQML